MIQDRGRRLRLHAENRFKTLRRRYGVTNRNLSTLTSALQRQLTRRVKRPPSRHFPSRRGT